MVNLDHMTGGMLYLSIAHLQREDTLQVFGCAGHIRPALWPRGCYCKHKGTEADVLPCQIYRFRALLYRCSRSDTFTPSTDTPHGTSYALGWHLLPAVVLSAPAPVLRLLNCPGPQAVPLEGRCTQSDARRSDCCHGLNFEGEAMLFFKSISRLSLKALFDCTSSIRRGAPKVNNQF